MFANRKFGVAHDNLPYVNINPSNELEIAVVNFHRARWRCSLAAQHRVKFLRSMPLLFQFFYLYLLKNICEILTN